MDSGRLPVHYQASINLRKTGMGPFDLNFGEITGAVSHFKFLSDFHAAVTQAVLVNQHADNSAKYRDFNRQLQARGDFSLMYEQSRRYLSPADLVECGYISRIDWCE